MHTQLDPDTPYAIVTAPPSYGDTMLADMRLQQQQEGATAAGEEAILVEGEEAILVAQDALSNSDNV